MEKGTVLFRLDPSTFETRVAEFEAALSGARAARKFFRLQVQRISELEADEFAAQSRLDKLVRQRDEAAADVARLKAELRRARLDLDFATIEAPFAGKFGFANVDVGDLVTAGQTRLGSVVQVDPIEVTFSPSAEQLSAMERAQAEAGKAGARGGAGGRPFRPVPRRDRRPRTAIRASDQHNRDARPPR